MIFFILRDLVPVGLFIAEPDHARGLVVHLDYVIPGYRDLKPGMFLYSQEAERFKAQGIDHMYTAPGSKAHRDYWERMGFVLIPSSEDQPVYCRQLA
jgi:hypothetical protein